YGEAATRGDADLIPPAPAQPELFGGIAPSLRLGFLHAQRPVVGPRGASCCLVRREENFCGRTQKVVVRNGPGARAWKRSSRASCWPARRTRAPRSRSTRTRRRRCRG